MLGRDGGLVGRYAERQLQGGGRLVWGGIAVARTDPTRCPVQLHFGEKDAGIPLSDVDAIREAQPGVEIFVYPGAQHGFGCSDRSSYQAAAAALAQERTLGFLAEHL